MKYILLLLISISYVSSAQTPQKVLYSLQKAGKNRGELERVIHHYQQDKDSFKLKACYFLLENMVGHKHLDAENLRPFDTIFGVYDSLLTHKIVVHKQETEYPLVYEAWDKIVEKHEDPNTIEYPDLEHITATFLIDNIDGAFQAWHTYPWAKHLTFEQFCEYLLPYKMSNESLVPWRSAMMKKYAWLPDSLPNKSDEINATRVLYNNLKWFLFNPSLWSHPLVGFENLHTAKAGSCFNKTDLNMFVMRAMGLAVTRDFVLYWGNQHFNHYWNAFVMNDGTFLDFEALASPRYRWLGRMPKHKVVNPGRRSQWVARMSKVFRETYSEQSETLVEDNKIGIPETIPYQFDRTRIKDVTEEYTKTCNVTLDIPSSTLPYSKYYYLCTYNMGKWVPAFWGRRTNDNKALFRKMGIDIAYVLCKYNGKSKFEPLDNPFILDSLGNKTILAPPTNFAKTAIFSDFAILKSIQKDEVYKLFYWSKDQWIFHSESKAEDKAKITFGDVPVKTLLKLEKVNGKKNERIFYYANGVQYFY
ncbi:MAG: hypothetical protein ACOVOW_16680 [Spirosomataceae bacterium]